MTNNQVDYFQRLRPESKKEANRSCLKLQKIKETVEREKFNSKCRKGGKKLNGTRKNLDRTHKKLMRLRRKIVK